MEAAISGIVAQVGKFIGKEIQCQFTYLCCFSSNIQTLRHETQQLKDARDTLQMRVETAKRNAQVVFPHVETWLDSAKEKMDIINGVENEISSVQQQCLNQVKRYSISRKAKKTAVCLKEFRNGCQFEQIAQDAPPAASMVYIPNYGEMLAFESRKKVEEDIMEALKDGKVHKLGICGMAGVGKTTMAKRIMSRVKDESLFGDVVFLAVGQQVDQHKIQCEIAELLGLELKDESLSARAHKLRTRLLDTKKSSLIVVDDIWEKLKLDDLGIPCESDAVKCKVLLTSRNRDVLHKMETQNIFGVELLAEPEAWCLFREKIGDCRDKSDLHSVAKNVANECKGLPVALVTVGGALKDKVSKLVWDDALVQLRRCRPIHIPSLIEDVYIPIKFSYDKLETKAEKDLILLCSMFEEDSDINLDIITWYGMGLHLFEGTESFNGARNRTQTLVEVLKSRSLLLDGANEGYVKMHDVVRDTTRYVASDKDFMTDLDGMSMDCSTTKNRFKDCRCISMTLGSRMDSQFLVGLQSSNLRLLLLMQKEEKFSLREPELDIPESFFDGIKEISTLSLEDIWMKSLPPSTRRLQNLQTLRLSNCRILESIVVVSELLMLEIFSCRDCQKLEALPIEFTKLNRLKVFEIIGCRRLQTIAPGVISSFVCLEELTLRQSFHRWEGKQNGSNTNVALEELESLSNLTRLEIEIRNLGLVSEDISLPPAIMKYDILIFPYLITDLSYSKEIYPQRLTLQILMEVNISYWVVQLLRSSKDLILKGDGSGKVNFSELEHVKDLAVQYCNPVNLVNVTSHPSGAFLPMLEVLYLAYLESLEEIFDTKALGGKIVNISFQNLTKIRIRKCCKLRYLFPVYVARSLMQLEQLKLEHCEAMECVILGEGDEIVEGKNSDELLHLSFPKLKKLMIEDLPSLTTLCRGVQSIEFPKIIEILIERVPKLTSLMKAPETPFQQLFSDKVICGKELKYLYLRDYAAARISRAWCHQISNVAIFHNLEGLWVTNCDGIEKLKTPRIAQSLVRLKLLYVWFCSELIQVIGESDQEDMTDEDKPQTLIKKTLFPRLEELVLGGSPDLRFFCEWKHVYVEFPSLKSIIVHECSKMQAVSCEACAIPNLEELKLDDKTFKGEILAQWTGEMKEIRVLESSSYTSEDGRVLH